MGKSFILAEKPDAAKKMAAAYNYKARDGYYEIEKCPTFPDGAYVGFAVGHLVELLLPEDYDEKYKSWNLNDLPVIPEVFKYKIINGKQQQFQKIKKIANDPSVTELIIGTDAGREGELIGVSIFKLIGVYGKKPIKRLWVSSMTADSFRKGFNNLRDGSETVNYYHESYARSVCDYMVGINVTRSATIHLQKAGISNQGVFSVGRVQTPVLKIIVDREREIENFVSKPYWTVQAQFDMNGKSYLGKWYRQEKDSKIVQLSTKAEADQLVNFCLNKKATLQDITKERKVVQPPKLHSLSTLQTLAGKKFKYSPSKTLEISQKLYTSGFISYPRSDSNAITKEEAKQFPNIFNKLKGFSQYATYLPTPIQSENLSSRYIDPSKVSDHYALIPTEQVPDINKLSQDEINIYDIIVRSVIAAHYEDAVFDHTSVITIVNERETFVTKGKVLVNDGWRKVIYPTGNEDDKEEDSTEDDENSLLPDLSKGESGLARKVDLKEGKTKSKPRLSSSNLINVMKYPAKFLDSGNLNEDELEGEMASLAIGTEATRAGIIDTLIQRKFIEVKRNKVYATEKGKILIDALGSNTILCSPVLTAKWESVLAKIGKGQVNSGGFIEKGKELTITSLNALNERSKQWNFEAQKEKLNQSESLGRCPLCNHDVVDNGKFYNCSGYKENSCKFGISHEIAKKKISAAQIKKLLKNGQTDEIKGFTGRNERKFDTFLYWNAEGKKIDWGFNKNKKPNVEATSTGMNCPFCKADLLDRESFIGCSGFKDGCKFTIPKVSFEKKLSDQHIRDLIEKGETEKITGFKGKYGQMDGTLYIDNSERKVKFRIHKNI
ncbi:DNA topoisomerase 3 [Viridibacillus arvi]|uniref:DNA topoisomerase 3 n=1 Tax=Viridibacillus arvi TaxID=263475 RepID=UPI0034CF4C82